MKSRELFLILLVIILVLHLLNKKETFLNLINKKESFLNLTKFNKNKIQECCKENCHGKPEFQKDKNCDKNKVKNKKSLKNQINSKFKSLQEFYDKRPKFELETPEAKKPLVEKEERNKKLKESIKTKEYMPGFISDNTNYGKPGFYVK